MAAPRQKLISSLIFGGFRLSKSKSFLLQLAKCERLQSNTRSFVWQPYNSSRIKARPLNTSCQTLSTTNSSQKPSEEEKEPKPGILKRIALRSHHGTIKLLDRVSPRARVFYERFVDGATSFVQDFRFVYSLNKKLKSGEVKLEDVEWRDLYKKMQMKQDVAKVLPVLVVVNIPFVYYVTLPIVLYFQRIFLSDHFISPEDVANNRTESHKKRRLLYPLIVKRLNGRLSKKPVSELAESMQKRLDGTQVPFSSGELQTYQPLFSQQTALNSLSRTHLKYLCKLHSQWVFLAGRSTLRKRLTNHANLMSCMDRAILKAGLEGVEDQDLRKLCYQRGLNPVELDRQELTDWLTEWTIISTNLSDAEWSLLLHASILLVTGRPHQGDGQAVKREPATKEGEL